MHNLERGKHWGLVLVFIWFTLGGVAHFVYTDFMLAIVPPYVPYPRTVVYLSGIAELIAACGLIPRRTRSWAGQALIVLICGVSLANIHMSLHPELFPQFPEWMLTARLVLQVLLIACVWWSTQPDTARFDSR